MEQQTQMQQQKPKQPQPQNPSNLANVARLVRRGLLPSSDLPTLKMAMINSQRKGDVAKLPKNQRDVLQRYNAALSSAAYGSQGSYAAVAKNVAKEDFEISRTEYITEASLGSDPPMMLVLKRTGVRIFPDGKRVALYKNDKLNLSFTIPYSSVGPEQELVGVSEEVGDVMESLEQVAKFAQQDNVTSNSRHFKFADGSKLKVSHGAAKAIHMVHGALNPENQKKFADMLTTPKGFEKAAHFALSKVQFTIGGK
jgi:hypothetical protein